MDLVRSSAGFSTHCRAVTFNQCASNREQPERCHPGAFNSIQIETHGVCVANPIDANVSCVANQAKGGKPPHLDSLSSPRFLFLTPILILARDLRFDLEAFCACTCILLKLRVDKLSQLRVHLLAVRCAVRNCAAWWTRRQTSDVNRPSWRARQGFRVFEPRADCDTCLLELVDRLEILLSSGHVLAA